MEDLLSMFLRVPEVEEKEVETTKVLGYNG